MVTNVTNPGGAWRGEGPSKHPIDGILAVLHEPGVGLGEMFAAEEAFVGAEWGGVRGFEDEMFGLVDEYLFFLREFAPEEVDEMLFLGRNLRDDGVGEFGPADLGVAHGFVGADGEGGVEEEDTLFGPVGEIALFGDGHPDVLVQFFINVDEGWGRRDALLDGEAEAVGLTGAVVGVLAEEDDLDLVEGGGVERVEDKAAGRIDRPSGHPFGLEMGDDLEEVGFREFGLKDRLPTVFNLDVH